MGSGRVRVVKTAQDAPVSSLSNLLHRIASAAVMSPVDGGCESKEPLKTWNAPQGSVPVALPREAENLVGSRGAQHRRGVPWRRGRCATASRSCRDVRVCALRNEQGVRGGSRAGRGRYSLLPVEVELVQAGAFTTIPCVHQMLCGGKGSTTRLGEAVGDCEPLKSRPRRPSSAPSVVSSPLIEHTWQCN